MKELIPKDTYGVFADNHDTARVDSLYVAKYFEKRHDHVIRDIEKLTAPESGLSREFNLLNFGEISYRDSRNRKQKSLRFNSRWIHDADYGI